MNPRRLIPAFFILTVFYISTHLAGWLSADQWPFWIRYLLPYVIWSLTIALSWVAVGREILTITGLNSALIPGILWGCLFVSPMIAGFALSSTVVEFSPLLLVQKALLPGFFEELMFRGFLVGMLISIAKWHFFPAALVNAVIFGLGHWFQGATPYAALLASVFTGVGGIWFAWLFFRWRRNLWLVVTLHVLMNACWVVWQVDNTAVGGQLANVLRLSTIGLSVLVTLYIQRKPLTSG